MEERVVFENSKGNKLSAILSNPTEETNCPMVILCHGLNSNKDSVTNVRLNEVLLKHGIASFRFDFFAHGESEGKIEERSAEEFTDDVLKAIDYLKGRGYNNFGIHGTSFGGVAAVMAASRSSDLKVMVLKCTGIGTSGTMPNYKKDFENKTWIKAGEKITIPTLVIHGDEDKDVELQSGKELAESIKTSRLEILEGADHKFSNDYDKPLNLASEFIINNLQTQGFYTSLD